MSTAHEVHHKETDERQTVVGQERLAVEESPAPDAGARESRQKAPPAGIPSAAPPTPPGGRLAASIQRIPPAGRWTLCLALAFLSNFVFVLLCGPSLGVLAVASMVAFAPALAAGFVFSRWWALLALAIAMTAGGWVGTWAFVQMAPAEAIAELGGMAAVFDVFAFIAILDLGPLIVMLLTGGGLGEMQGIAQWQPQTLSAGQARVSRWIAALVTVIAGGFLTHRLGNMPGDVLGILPDISYAIVLATTCLLAGWLLRSWWGLVVAPIVYIGVATLVSLAFEGNGSIWTVGFVLYIVLPAVVMSAIGTAIGMYRARRRGPAQRADHTS